MNRSFVRRCCLFGKARPRPSVKATDYWGSRKGIKRVQIYFKKEINRLRIELDLRPKFLRKYSIEGPEDFHNLVAILPRRHILFAKLNKQKLCRQLRNMELPQEQRIAVFREVQLKESDLWMTLRYLRSVVGMKNTQRILVPIRANKVARQALEEWAAKWPKGPRRLGGKK
jgi:hypothetical protein